jgi:hypothetical protein
MQKQVAFRGITLYLFMSGILALVISPYLAWFYYGVNFMFPAQVSLVWLFENSFFVFGRISLLLYAIGVVASVMVPLVKGKPVFFQGVLSVLFPLFILVTFSFQPYYPHVQTAGLFSAFLGSILLEASYFAYRRKAKTVEHIGAQSTNLEQSLP